MANKSGDDPAGIKKNIEKVIRKAENGDIRSMIKIAHTYVDGVYVPQDWFAAEAWLRKAAELGSDTAGKELADLLSRGNGVAQNLEEAFDIYHDLMLDCDLDAMAAVGTAYKLGKGVPKDEAKGSFFLRNAFNIELGLMEHEQRRT